jgi:hypothetical protein
MGIMSNDPSFDQAVSTAIGVARSEIESGMTASDVHRQTAITWLGRSLAAFEKFLSTRNVDDLLSAEEFGSEAVEHAALAFDVDLVQRVGSSYLYARQSTLRSAGLKASARFQR